MLTTFNRTGIIMAMLNEDVLELMLSTLPLDHKAVAEDILIRSKQAYDALPEFVKQPPLGKRATEMLDMVSLDFEYNSFLVYRVLVRKQVTNNDQLINAASSILAKVIGLIRQHRSTSYTGDLPWIISKYTLPPAGVLCIELLRQTQGHATSPALRRSEVVQNLSSLLPSLKWITTRKTVNHEICEQARSAIQRILDTVLEAPTPPPQVGYPQTPNSDAIFDGMDQAEDGIVDGMSSSTVMSGLQTIMSTPEFWAKLPSHLLIADT